MGKGDPRLKRLFASFKNRNARWESDCAVIGQILAYFANCDEGERRIILHWVLKQLEKPGDMTPARKILAGFLFAHRKALSKKQRQRFKEIVDVAKKTKKHRFRFAK